MLLFIVISITGNKNIIIGHLFCSLGYILWLRKKYLPKLKLTSAARRNSTYFSGNSPPKPAKNLLSTPFQTNIWTKLKKEDFWQIFYNCRGKGTVLAVSKSVSFGSNRKSACLLIHSKVFITDKSVDKKIPI